MSFNQEKIEASELYQMLSPDNRRKSKDFMISLFIREQIKEQRKERREKTLGNRHKSELRNGY